MRKVSFFKLYPTMLLGSENTSGLNSGGKKEGWEVKYICFFLPDKSKKLYRCLPV